MINTALYEGRLGKAIEIRKTMNGTSVCNFSLANTKVWKDESGNRNEDTTWFPFTAYGAPADLMAQFVKVGDAVSIEGELRSDRYEQDGQTRYKTYVRVRRVHLLPNGSRQEQQEQAPPENAWEKEEWY